MSDGLILALDTSTRLSVVVAGVQVAAGLAAPSAVSRREVRHGHGAHLLEQIDEVLDAAGASLDDITSLAVGTGPGSFTGLRVGLATAKTMAYAMGLPLVGLRSSDALRRAGATAGGPDQAAVVLPAGARDQYLARWGEEPVLVAPGGLAEATAGAAVLAVDVSSEELGAEASRLGEAALDWLPVALLAMARERLAAGMTDDVAALVPAYVALPRGVHRAAEDLGWSPDLR